MQAPASNHISKHSGSKLGRIIKWVLIGLVVLLLIAYFGIGFYAAGEVIKPERISIDPNNNPARVGLEYEDVRLKSRGDNVDIAAWYIPSDENRRVILFVHGRNANRTAMFDEGSSEEGHLPDFALALHNAGFSVMAIDLRGHGDSGPSVWSFGIKERNDVLGAVDWLVEKGYRSGEIGVYGLSLGSAASIGAANEDPRITALVSDSVFADLNPLIQSQWEAESGLPKIFLYPTLWMVQLRYGFDLTKAVPMNEIDDIADRPILLIHCTTDEEVPVSHVEMLKAAAPSAETWLIPGCPHSEAYNAIPEEYTDRVVKYFLETIP